MFAGSPRDAKQNDVQNPNSDILSVVETSPRPEVLESQTLNNDALEARPDGATAAPEPKNRGPRGSYRPRTKPRAPNSVPAVWKSKRKGSSYSKSRTATATANDRRARFESLKTETRNPSQGLRRFRNRSGCPARHRSQVEEIREVDRRIPETTRCGVSAFARSTDRGRSREDFEQ